MAKKEQDNATPSAQAAALWKLVRQGANARANGTGADADASSGANKPAGVTASAQQRELEELEQLSGLFTRNVASRTTNLESAARNSFNHSHQQLMDAIAASPQSAPSSPAVSSLARLALRRILDALAAPFATRAFWTLSSRACLLSLCLAGALWAGRVWAFQEVAFLPLGNLADTYERRQQQSLAQWVLGEADPNAAEQQMEKALGMNVALPRPAAIGGTLVYVKTAETPGVEGLEAHYKVPQGTLGYVQAWAPRLAVRFAREMKVGNDVYMLRQHSQYLIVAWRFGDSVAAIFSPFDEKTSMDYAVRMRQSARKTYFSRQRPQ